MASTTNDTPPTATRPRRRALIIGAVAVVAALVAVVLIVFQPQKLFLDTTVDEQLEGEVVALGDVAPTSAPTTTPTTAAPPAAAGAPASSTTTSTVAPTTVPADPYAAATAQAATVGSAVEVTSGGFVSLDHPTSGTARIIVQPDGSRLLRFEGLDTDNGPDLRVVLSPAEVGTASYGTLIELGPLKGNVGNQNYEIPADVDLASIRSVVIWCERFSVGFGEAPLVVAA